MPIRTALPDFALRNPLYAGATVDVWTVNLSLAKTNVRATLYAAPTGPATLTNPQVLDSQGKWAQPVYVEIPVAMTVTPVTAAPHDTGISDLLPRWRGVWAPGTTYFPNERVRHPTANITYMVNTAHVSGVFSADAAAGRLEYEFDLTEVSTPVALNVKTGFGAAGDGTTDDTAAIQAAIAFAEALAGVSQGGAIIDFPGGDYRVTDTLVILKSFVRLRGIAPQGTRLVFFNMTGKDWITFGSVAIANIRRGGLENLSLWGGTGNTIVQNANGSTSGAAIKCENTFDMHFDRLAVENVLCGFDIGRGTNGTNIQNTTIIPNQAGSLYGINWWCPGDGTYRSDVLRIDNVVIGGQWSDATGLNWQGFCNTLIGNGLRILHLAKGMRISNPTASISYFPSFLNISDLELEGFKARALEILGGTDFKITNSDINNLTTGHPSQGGADDHAIYVAADTGASITRALNITNTRIGGCQQSGIYSDSRDLQLTGVVFYTTSYAGSGSFPVVRLGPNTRKALITNMIAEEFGGAARASYGVQVDNGATGVNIVGLDASSVVTDAILDGTTERVTAVNIIAPGVTPVGLVHFPAQRRTQTRYAAVGGSVESVVYNTGVGISTWARDQVSTGTANSYVIRGLNDNAGAPYYQTAAGPAVTRQWQDFPVHNFRNMSGVSQFAVGELLPNFADDAAAATGGINVGGWYYNTTSGRERQRRS